MNDQIKKFVNKIILNISENKNPVDFSIEHPTDLKNGDYSTNVAMILAKENNKNPREMADYIVESMKNSLDLPDDIEKIEVAGPGFINFYLKNNFFGRSVLQAVNGESNYGRNKKLEGKHIVIEYTDPNPLKQFHIGHLMSNSIGESIARILEWNGAKVTRVCYQGDVGMHVAKSIYGMKKNIDLFPSESTSLDEKMIYLGRCYTEGANNYEDDPVARAEINEINKKVYELYDENKSNNDLEIENLYKKGREWSLLSFQNLYMKLGTSFEKLIFESQMASQANEIIRANTPSVFEMSDGAIIYRGESDGLHTRVFINSLGLPTYEAKDVALAFFKESLISQRFGKFDISIIVTASEQKEYYKVVMAAMKKMRPEITDKTLHITHGMMRFSDAKMSSRKGNVITAEQLIDDIEKMVDQKITERSGMKNFEFDLDEKAFIKEIVAIGAIKYSILKQAIGKDIVFDKGEAVSFEGDSGPYLQYTFTRANSVVENAIEKGIQFVDSTQPNDWNITDLEKYLYRFPEVVYESYSLVSPHLITNYLLKVASEFNTYYSQNQILDGSKEQAYKIQITKAVKHIIQNGLKILGIKTINRM